LKISNYYDKTWKDDASFEAFFRATVRESINTVMARSFAIQSAVQADRATRALHIWVDEVITKSRVNTVNFKLLKRIAKQFPELQLELVHGDPCIQCAGRGKKAWYSGSPGTYSCWYCSGTGHTGSWMLHSKLEDLSDESE
jgi:hypothetical protein